MFEGIFYFFLSAISSAMSTWLFLVRNFPSRFIITSKFIFVNYLLFILLKLNSGVVIKIVVSDILFSISLAFIFGPDLVARLIIPVIFNISYFISNLCGLNFLSPFFLRCNQSFWPAHQVIFLTTSSVFLPGPCL